MSDLHYCSKCGYALPTTGELNYCPRCGNALGQSRTPSFQEIVRNAPAYSYRSKPNKIKLSWLWFSLAGIWTGFMIATAGIAIAPSLGKIAAPFVCDGGFSIKSTHYSYKPGQSGVTRQFYCQDNSSGESPREVTGSVIGWSMGIYCGLGTLLGLMSFAIFRIIKKIKAP